MDALDPTPEIAEEFRQLMQDPAARQAFVELKQEKAKEGIHVRYSHVLKAVLATPWAIHSPYMGLVADILVEHIAHGHIDAADMEARLEAARRPQRSQAPEGVAVIPMQGVIVPKANMFTEVSGGTSVEGLRASFRSALAAPDVKAIVFDVDSPGGSVDQIPEFAAELRAARGKKPIVAVANGMMASGAYWLGSQADEVVVTKSGLVGSIGVITAHEDITKAAEMEGVNVSLITAGKFKSEGHPLEPLTDEGRDHIQGLVDSFYNMFVGDVAKGRKAAVEAVRNGFGEGRVVGATESLKEGMADRIDTLENVVGGLLTEPQGVRLASVAGLASVVDPKQDRVAAFTSGTTTTTTNLRPMVSEGDAWLIEPAPPVDESDEHGIPLVDVVEKPNDEDAPEPEDALAEEINALRPRPHPSKL